MSEYIQHYNSPIGNIKIQANDDYLESVSFVNLTEQNNPNEITNLASNQLHEYFMLKRKLFTIPFRFQGTSFSNSVLQEVVKIKYGRTASYKTIANVLGNENKVRAVGNVNSRNQLLIVIPCHRIIGSKGQLIGYAGGLNRKQWLLEHEGSITQQRLF
ncbi:MAG: methylated-DNA--[protein]-cysteine S-methyltransferase [Bacteroidia bacterium]|nr:methylated-DNA--[protein]-cysteine S-methyltransferase [Bacteroidia bacterium]NNJ56535.1 methylated-DNA--[protein]-cysteine S-methyltransferase [Bacteroidia bacterium]